MAVSNRTMVFTGDLAILRPLPATCEAEPLFTLLRESALTAANLEVPLTTATVPADKAATLRADPDRASDLAALGVDVASLANNHSFDFGIAGYRETREALKAHGIAVVGAGENVEAALQPVLRSVGGWRVAIFGLATTLPPGFAAGPERPGVAPIRVLHHLSVDPALIAEQPGIAPFVHTRAVEADLERVSRAIDACRREADFVVVLIHWGVPHGWTPPSQGVLAEYQPDLGRRLIDAGADLVVGHHPHAVHPAEWYGDGLIAYSLGNFMFHGWPGLEEPAWELSRAVAGGGSLTAGVPAFVPPAGVHDRVALQGLAAPYHVPFGDPLTHESVVLVVELPPVPPRRGKGLVRYRWIPTVMDAGGNPRPADPDRARDILRRLAAGAGAGIQGITLGLVDDPTLQTVVGEVMP